MNKALLTVFLAIAMWFNMGGNASAQMIVLDPTNLVQNTITAIHQILAYAEQIEQYILQGKQYADQLVQAALEIEHLWQEIVASINRIEEVAHLFENGNDLAGTVELFHDLNYWLNIPSSNYAFRGVDTTNWVNSSTTMITAIQAHQTEVGNDAHDLETIQGNTQDAGGRNDILKSIASFLSFLAKGQTHQRMTEISAQQMTFSREAQQANRTAMEQAGTMQYTGTLGGPQDHVPW